MMERQQQIEILRKRHQAAPDSKVFAPLADLLGKDGQTEEALALLEDGLARHPDYLSGMVVLGRILMRAQRRDHGRKVLVRVLDLDPDNHVALGILAEDAVQQEVWHIAEPWLTKLVKVEGAESEWTPLLEKARNRLANPDLPAAPPASEEGFATMTLVDIYIEQGYLKKALGSLKLIESRDPAQPGLGAKIRQVETLLRDQREKAGDSPETSDKPGSDRQHLAEKRARNKQKFQDWIESLDEEGTRPS